MNTNNYIRVGLVFNSLFLVGNRIDFIPDFILGFCAALGLILIFVGIYSENHDLCIKYYKKTLVNRIIRRHS